MARRLFLSLAGLLPAFLSLPLARLAAPRPPRAGEGWGLVRGSWVALSVPALSRQLKQDLFGAPDGHDVLARREAAGGRRAGGPSPGV